MSNSEFSDSKSNENEGWGIAPWICIVLAVLFLAAGGFTAYRDWPGWSPSKDWNNAGARGDYWGGHFAAASGLAGTLILFAALLLQGKELKLQRKELRESRRVAERQAKALDEQTSELKAQNDNLKRQIGLTESRDEIQLIMSIANEVKQIEREVDSHPRRNSLDYEGPATIESQRLESLRRNQGRLVQFATARIVLRFEVDRSMTEDNLQIFFAHLPESLHEIGFKSLETAVRDCNPSPDEVTDKRPTYEWVRDMKLLIQPPL